MKAHLGRHIFASIGLCGLVLACTQNGVLPGANSNSKTQSIALEPSAKANDRPTETGAGVPGYLVGCSIFTLEDDLAQVGCNISDSDGQRIFTTADAFSRYDIRLSAAAKPGITVTKALPTTPEVWDVNFNFRGADRLSLNEATRSSAYGYAYTNAGGQTVRIETKPLPPAVEATPAPATAPNLPVTCTGGVLVDAVCFVSVESSCDDYCAKGGMTTHPWVNTRFGAALESNQTACNDLYAKMRNSTDFRTGDTHSRGLGCYEENSGRVVFDKNTTDTSKYPQFGHKRICACQ